MSFKLKCEEYVDWNAMTVEELKIHITLNTLPHREIEKLLRQHLFNDEVTGWAYKLLYLRRDSFDNIDKTNKFTF